MAKIKCAACLQWHKPDQTIELIPKNKDLYQLEVLLIMNCPCGHTEMARYFITQEAKKTQQQRLHERYHQEFITRTKTDLAKKDEPEQREMRPKPIVGDATLLMCTPADQNIEKKEKMFRVTA